MFGPWYGGRGFGGGWGRGYGATLGYCPWTGLPRGWRWNYPYYGAYSYYGTSQYSSPYTASGYFSTPFTGTSINEKEALEREYRYLQERMEEIKKRLDELNK